MLYKEERKKCKVESGEIGKDERDGEGGGIEEVERKREIRKYK